jgi:hypothetical protein
MAMESWRNKAACAKADRGKTKREPRHFIAARQVDSTRRRNIALIVLQPTAHTMSSTRYIRLLSNHR